MIKVVIPSYGILSDISNRRAATELKSPFDSIFEKNFIISIYQSKTSAKATVHPNCSVVGQKSFGKNHSELLRMPSCVQSHLR